MSNNLIYTTGMTMHSSGNPSSQVPLKENGRFAKCFSPHIHHIFLFLGTLYSSLARNHGDSSFPCQGLRPYIGIKGELYFPKLW
jgi:hypothetical protein